MLRPVPMLHPVGNSHSTQLRLPLQGAADTTQVPWHPSLAVSNNANNGGPRTLFRTLSLLIALGPLLVLLLLVLKVCIPATTALPTCPPLCFSCKHRPSRANIIQGCDSPVPCSTASVSFTASSSCCKGAFVNNVAGYTALPQRGCSTICVRQQEQAAVTHSSTSGLCLHLVDAGVQSAAAAAMHDLSAARAASVLLH